MAEAHPQAVVIPAVLFTDRRKWRKDVDLKSESAFCGETFLLFKYLQTRLFNYNVRDYYDSDNPLVTMLLPEMNCTQQGRFEVIRQAYKGLFRLAAPMQFDKYINFIDIYAEIEETEREHIYSELKEQKETAMLAQYIKEKGIKEGVQQGISQGVWQGETQLLCTLIAEKCGIDLHIESFAQVPEDDAKKSVSDVPLVEEQMAIKSLPKLKSKKRKEKPASPGLTAKHPPMP